MYLPLSRARLLLYLLTILHPTDTGGATYCAVASLRLMGYIGDDLLSESNSSSLIDVPLLLDWSLQVLLS